MTYFCDMIMEYTLDDIGEVAAKLATSFNHSVVAFNGAMGSGKTTLIKAIVKHLGSDNIVSSPTFGLVHEYATQEALVYHMDLYRLEGVDELEQLGVEDYILSGNLCLIEWPNLLEDHINGHSHTITISSVDEHKRKLEFL
ncbi:MAG: tRNA (adenosine(37)-N6)-threonylcarbamoyltransferase complex ATPase subunit type 1 TsaE [Flavobacteriaceae bacterium]|nr:tRNA (adenosine(37)-N6)-threonylcarbamoyltransferase complex ATPase subunit type 1 TsaE [Flavobacteriaceae bacterium]